MPYLFSLHKFSSRLVTTPFPWRKEKQISLKYCVLLAEEETLKKRDSLRKEIERTGDLSIQSRNEFLAKNIKKNHLLFTDQLDARETARIIKTSIRFVFEIL